jgi:hypothetical protein
LAEAIEESVKHQHAFRSFTVGLCATNIDIVRSWEQDVIAWEKDMTLPCPYEEPESSKSLDSSVLLYSADHATSEENTVATVKGRLAAQDHKAAIKGTLDFSKTNVTLSSFIATGLDLEAAQ